MVLTEEFALDENRIVFLEPCTYEEAIVSLVNSMSTEIDGKDTEVIEKVLEREKVVPTAIGRTIAIPHGRCPFLDTFTVAIGIIQGEGINWGAMDKEAVKIVCLIAGPADKPCEYLSFLSHLTSILKEEDLRMKILNESNKKNIVNIFRSW